MEFLTKYVGELRKPLMWRQGSKVSMAVARGACQCFRVMIGESGLKTRIRRTLEVFLMSQQENLESLDLGR